MMCLFDLMKMIMSTVLKFCTNLFCKFGSCVSGFVSGIFKFFHKWGNMASRRGPKTIEKLVEVMIPLFDLKFEQDDVILNHGNHEIFIPTDGRVKRVWFTFTDVRYIPVCQGAADMVGITTRPDGFVINAVINSEYRGIRYFAVIKNDEDHGHDDEDDDNFDDEDFNRLAKKEVERVSKKK